jgi:peptide/nickel transport system permease protein
MTKFIIRRLFLGAIIVFLGSMVLYAVIRCLPTSYVENIARQRASLPGGKSYTEWLSQLNSVYSLDTDIFTGFFRWLSHAIQGEFGESWAYNMPVVQKFSSVIWYSVVSTPSPWCLNLVCVFLWEF